MMFCQIDVRMGQWMLTEVVDFINNYGGKIQLSLFKTFLRLRSNSDWKCCLRGNGAKRFCEESHGELIWATNCNGVTVSTKCGQVWGNQSSWRSPTTVTPKVIFGVISFLLWLLFLLGN